MSFYSDFAEHYEDVFPFRETVYSFLRDTISGLSGVREKGLVLDAGCGTGHYCGRFTADGFDALGIDPDPAMIRVAEDNYPGSAFRCLNMLEIGCLGRTFDAVFCIGNVAAHLTRDQFRAFTGILKNVLRPGGLWIFQVVNWDYVLTRDSHRFPPRAVDDGEIVFSRRYTDISEDRLRFSTRLTAGKRTIFSGEVWLHPVRAADYMAIHAARGFRLLGHYADFRQTPFRPDIESGSVYLFRRDQTHPLRA